MTAYLSEEDTPDTRPQSAGTQRNIRLANEAWESLFQAQVSLMRIFTAENIWQDLSIREYDVLYALTKGPETGLRLCELNEKIPLSQPSLSRMAERLEKRGLVRRSQDPSDGRSVNVCLTDKGRELQRSIGRKHATTVASQMNQALDHDQLLQLIELCSQLREKS